MSLSALFLPYPISSGYTTSYTELETVSYEPNNFVIQVREQKNIDNIINNYVNQLHKEGYQKVDIELNNNKVALLLNSINKEINIIELFDFYTNYIQLKNEDNIYLFKTKEESDNFINNINQYLEVNFEIQENVRKEVRSETKEEEIVEAISQIKKKAAEIEMQQKIAAAAYEIVDISDIATDNAIVNYALQFNGNPYVYGGTSLTNGADCSGFVQSIFAEFGIFLPRTAVPQSSTGTPVEYSNLQPGDLLFFDTGGEFDADHVGIYIGGSKIIHAGSSSTGIHISSANILTKYCARRVL